MSKVKPLIIIVAAVALAAAAAGYLSKPAADELAPPDLGTFAAPAPPSGRTLGAADAPVTLVEFGDYQCPWCKVYHPMVTELLRRYSGRLKFEYRHYPLVQIHPHAMDAALAAEAAGDQGRYWEMHDLLFASQEQWSQSRNPEPEFMALAQRLGLDMNRFSETIRSATTQRRVLDDVLLAREARVDGTPTFFINGHPISLPPGVDEFSQLIEMHLRAAE